ncbi:MAG: hypothetical protein JW748_05560 [Anaerolineales bacterium]|nr:hypothetical protein [Anaerolineales bacterium]
MPVKRLTSIRIFAVWLIGFGLTLVIVLLWHELLMVFVVNTLGWGRYAVPLVHITYYCGAGLLWVAFFIIDMEYLNRSVREGRLFEAASITIGAQLWLIALGQAGLTLYGFFPADALGIALIGGEGLAGAILLGLAKYWKRRPNGFGRLDGRK